MKCPVVVVVVALAAALVPGRAAAAERVGLAFADGDIEAEYSQGVNLELVFVDKDGDPLSGLACDAETGRRCAIEVEITRADGTGETFDVTAPDVVVDDAGRARARLTLVDGRHGGAVFASDPDGLAYTLTARFRGVDPDDNDCQPDATGTADGTFCATTATATLLVRPEVLALEFNVDIVLDVGDRVTLAATLTDPSGDADAAGEEIDGPGPKPLEGLPVRFFYDQNDDGRPSANERLPGEATTNAAGVAALEFFADPAFVQAGVFDAGLHAEFPGDDRYAVARTSVKLTLIAGGPDPARTIIEVDPKTVPADGVTTATIVVRLVDEDNNLLGVDAPPHDVVITATEGVLQESVARDPLDGTYSQVIRSQKRGAVAEINVTVDGEDAGTAELVIEGEPGCACASSSGSSSSSSSSSSPSSSPSSPLAGLLAACFVIVTVLRVRRHV